MKKTILMSAVLVIALSLSACGKKEDKKEQSQGASSGQEEMAKKEDTSLLDWLKIGRAVECRVQTPEGEVKMIAKDKVVRIEGKGAMSGDSDSEFGAENGVILATEDWTYFWDTVKKEGSKFNHKEFAANTAENSQEEEPIGDWEEMAGEWEREQIPYECKDIVVSDAELMPPSDVVFTDLGEIFSGMADSVEAFDTERLQGIENMSEEELQAEIDKMLEGMEAGE